MMFLAALAEVENENSRIFLLDLYKQYYSLVRKTVFSITKDVNHVEDLINDTFVRLIEKVNLLSGFDSCRLTAYVVYTARSVAINFIKHRDVERKHAFYGDEADMAESVTIENDKSLSEDLIAAEDAEQLKNAILKLPQGQKDILYFKYFLEMPDTQIAAALGIAPGSVRTYLTRARRAAKELLPEEV